MSRAAVRRVSSTGERGVSWSRSLSAGPGAPRAFSLLELIIVMSVTLMLTGMMLPALVQVRENAHRVVCSSNLRQIGLAVVMYTDDHDGDLPFSAFALPGGSKPEMMAVHRGKTADAWDGLGWVYSEFYFNAPQIFYCPSHRGMHQYERYEEDYRKPGRQRIYSNYHYAGQLDWQTGAKRRLSQGEGIVLATDGMRTKRDFNHVTGTNVLRGDNSVNWFDDASDILHLLPSDDMEMASDDWTYAQIWELIGGSDARK